MSDVKTYSLSKNGNQSLSTHFNVKEFCCKDGSDKILISDELVRILELVRTHFGKAVSINSAYRTKTYNARVGGSSGSQHVLGTAADIVVKDTNPLAVALYLQSIMPNYGGIGLYKKTSNFVHVDVRSTPKRWMTTVGTAKYVYVSKIMPTVKVGSSGESVEILQLELNITADGKFGEGTKAKVIQFQKDHKLTPDGIVGNGTWTELGKQ